MLELQDLSISQIPLLVKFLGKYPRISCDYSICNLMTWGKIYKNQYAVWKDHLILVNPKYGYLFYPVGPGLDTDGIRELFESYREQEPEAELILLPEDWETINPRLDEHFVITDERDWSDYVYSVERMVKLSGKKLAKKKNLVSQYARNYPDYHVVPVTRDKADMIITFTEKWKRERNAEGIYLNTEFNAIRNTLEMWDDIPVEGLIICHQHSISAYSIFSPMTRDMATVHFEKFDPDMKGSAQIIYWETARHLQKCYKWVNREQDMGLEGLRQAKMSYDPDLLVKFITAKPRN